MQGVSELRDAFTTFKDAATAYFLSVHEVVQEQGPHFFPGDDPDAFWNLLPEELQEKSETLQRELLRWVGQFTKYVKRASLLSEADENDLRRSVKELRAALKLRVYRSWDTEILNDEDVVLGVRPAGQSDSHSASPHVASRAFLGGMDQLSSLLELVEASPEAMAQVEQAASGNTAKYRPNTVFVMMWIDPTNPTLEDVYNTIKSCCAEFGLKAIRADEIEHEEVITDRILSEIKTSEFLIADITGERPSVYYEIGYAHSLRRRVIMYRKEGTRVHFDLAAYNCPEYRNITDLRDKLRRRLEEVTNRRRSVGS